MGILDAYQDSTDTALRVMATQPLTPEPVTPKHSTWSAPFRAVAAGAAEVAGNVMDTAGAFGQVSAAAGGLTPGFDPDAAKNRNATVEAFDKLKTDGINWRTDEAQQAYKFGADLRPDPLTAGTAENIVFGLTKGLTKAIGAAATLGPVGGAAAFGVSEGLTTAEDLANQGVDQQTRSKVGAVTGAMSAAGVVLPVAGKTLAQTAGLVLVGGPASFMAQQQATRSILENANYGEIAKQYDPLDPVGLTVATLLPAGFAAYAKRGGFGVKPGPVADGQPVADNAPEPQGAVMPATQESIDAAMVQNLTVARDDHSSSINRIWLKPIDDSFIDDPFNVDPNSRAYTIGTVQAIDEAINLVGEKRFSELALPRSEKQATDTLYFDQAQRVEMVGRKIVDFYEKNPPPKFDEAPPTAPLPAVKDSLTTQTDAAKPATQDIAPDAYAARVEALTKDQPDLIARLDEAGQPVKLADELAAIKKQAQEGTDTEFGALDAPLLKTAIECALSLGAA